MKVIDLLNKIANGEEVPKKIRIDHWCYEFEWVEHDSNYYDKHEDIDLMSCLSMNEEELNYEVHELKEDKKIEMLIIGKNDVAWCEGNMKTDEEMVDIVLDIKDKINEIIMVINEMREDE